MFLKSLPLPCSGYHYLKKRDRILDASPGSTFSPNMMACFALRFDRLLGPLNAFDWSRLFALSMWW